MKPCLPQDAALPHLARALDGVAMAPVFAAALHGPQLLSCAVDRVKYRPTRSCSVSYTLRLSDPLRGEFDQRVSARFCSGGAAAQRQAQAADCVWVASPAGPAWQHAPDLDMFAYWLPNDAKLSATQLLCDDTELRARALPDVVRALVGDTARLLSHRCELVQLVPELRACARVTLQVQHRPGGDSFTHTLFAKADRERDGAQTHAAMLALHRSAAQSTGPVRTPRPLLWQPSTGLHWQLALPGMTLDAQLDAQAQPGLSADLAATVGQQLAALHGTPLSGLVPDVTVAGLQASIDKACDVLGLLDTAWRAPLRRVQAALTAQLHQRAHALLGQPAATLHGDLHPGNILVHAKRLSFIDLDDLRSGPAAFELGAWVAYTLSRAVLHGTPMQQAAPACRAFLAAYAQARGHTLDPAVDATWLAWSTAHHLLCRRACGGLATLKPGRYAAVPRLLALADAISQARHIDAAFDPELEAA
jgi:Phosphotransferase enzyme family